MVRVRLPWWGSCGAGGGGLVDVGVSAIEDDDFSLIQSPSPIMTSF